MAAGKRDANHSVVLMGVSSVDLVTPIPLTVDPATGRLRVFVAGYTGDPTPSSRAKRDANRVPVKIAETNDSNRVITAFSIDTGNNGWLMQGL